MFVTGAGTDVGKTLVTAFIAGYLQAQGRGVTTQKWVQTGLEVGDPDLKFHQQWIGEQPDISLDLRMPYSFFPAVAPHFAAKLAGVAILPEIIYRAYHALIGQGNRVVVEGAGGALVPISLGSPYSVPVYLIDMAIHLHLPIVVVVANQVGALHQALSTVESIQSRSGRLMTVILNQTSQMVDSEVLHDNHQTLSTLLPVPVISIGYAESEIGVTQNYEKFCLEFGPLLSSVIV